MQNKYKQAGLTLRHPTVHDGKALHQLVSDCPPLDENSCYANLLQCSHFSDTAIVAQDERGRLSGAITGYRLPDAPETLFVWQVAVHPRARGLGLAKSMLMTLIERCTERGVTTLHTTITRDNTASWALFRRVAEAHNADLEHSVHFERDQHFGGEHASEYLVSIGPLQRGRTGSTSASRSSTPTTHAVRMDARNQSQANGDAA